jgi:hypothetical protein
MADSNTGQTKKETTWDEMEAMKLLAEYYFRQTTPHGATDRGIEDVGYQSV